MEIGENMSKYFENLDEQKREYFKILSPEIPKFIEEYIDTPEMQKQAGISVSSGTYYSKIFNIDLWYSSLDHSIAVALIIWNFTKDKKQTLAGLFHDIATPTFKHCIDYLNGDYKNQESIEELTTEIIKNSKKIMSLLKRDGINLEEISDYKIYPIADNDTPKLSADRLEYTLSNGLGVRKKLWNLDEVKDIYNDINIQINEKGIQELGFKNKKLAEKFVKNMSILSKSYMDNETVLSMQFLSDIIKKMNKIGLITKKDLYTLSEKQFIEKIKSCDYDNISKYFNIWKNASKINESDNPVQDKYCVSINAKIRYINPLIKIGKESVRISEVSETAKANIDSCLNYKKKKYAYFDFNF